MESFTLWAVNKRFFAILIIRLLSPYFDHASASSLSWSKLPWPWNISGCARAKVAQQIYYSLCKYIYSTKFYSRNKADYQNCSEYSQIRLIDGRSRWNWFWQITESIISTNASDISPRMCFLKEIAEVLV